MFFTERLHRFVAKPETNPKPVDYGMSEGCSSTTSLNCIFGYTKGILSSLFPLFT